MKGRRRNLREQKDQYLALLRTRFPESAHLIPEFLRENDLDDENPLWREYTEEGILRLYRDYLSPRNSEADTLPPLANIDAAEQMQSIISAAISIRDSLRAGAVRESARALNCLRVIEVMRYFFASPPDSTT